MLPHTDQVRWFADEVHVHEASLRAYVRGALPAVQDVDDVVQESYLRIWCARLAQPIVSSKAFLFTVARHIMSDRARRTRRSPMHPSVDVLSLQAVEEGPSAADALDVREKTDLLGRAVSALPTRCQEIIVLHKIKGISQREVARQLGLSEKTVENQVSLGVKRCGAFFRRHGIEYF